jgi:hypothetical protein
MALPKPPQVKRDVSSFPYTHQGIKIRSSAIVSSAMKMGIVIAFSFHCFYCSADAAVLPLNKL